MDDNKKDLEHGNECLCGCNNDSDHGDDCCGCSSDGDEMKTMKVVLDDGTETEFGVVDIFEVEGYENQYIALVTLDGEEVYLYQYIESEDGTVILENIEDDDEFNAAAQEFENGIVEE